MRKELDKVYDPKQVEDRLYQNWMEKKYFHAEVNENKTPYCIVIPPPNITGQLHMGHALNNTLQDILIRWKRMDGYSAAWIPGTDHASISTEVKIVQKMASEGVTKDAIGRDGFLERAWAWKDQYGSTIVNQLKKLGCSCDWDRERFTMDEGLSKAVMTVFLKLHEKGHIYRGEKLINWCPRCQTTISDAEVDHEDKQGCFYHMKYPIKGTDEFMEFATTRPETILGDTAIAVNPKDERYTHFVGKTVIIPIVDREVPIIADEYVEMDFGTGVVKITPAHDPNDFEVGERHHLPRINVMNDDGTMNQNAGRYEGLDRFVAREKIVAEFQELGLFIKKEDITHAVGVHERCRNVIEPLLKLQWFVRMEELAKPAIAEYKAGNLKFYPERYGKTYLHWLENIRDWCISRQLWWGHRIPAYYCSSCKEMVVSAKQPDSCTVCGSTHFEQDEDTLDTWFSSALWPFSTLGWPDKTEELSYFYPTNVLVTAYDIIIFWVIRMVFSGMEQMGELPFQDVFINGLIRDSQGRKLSKSLGNGKDPLEVLDVYGTDALRLSLVMGSSMGNDQRFYEERVEIARNFCNKVWNASRFVLMNFDEEIADVSVEDLTMVDKWILSKVNTLAQEVADNLTVYELGMAAQKVYDFIWDEFCDWYIEFVKPRLYNQDDCTRNAALWTLHFVLKQALQLLHPFAPFITEEIFLTLQDKEETIMLSDWPKYKEEYHFPKEEKTINLIKDTIKGIRTIRKDMNVAPSKKAKLWIVTDHEEIARIFEDGKVFFAGLAFASDVVITQDKSVVTEDMVSVIVSGATIYMPFAELVDIAKEKERLQKERTKLLNEVERVNQKLANEGFVSKAPKKLIQEEKDKLVTFTEMLNRLDEQLANLEKRG